jgi:hypothetical protein
MKFFLLLFSTLVKLGTVRENILDYRWPNKLCLTRQLEAHSI